VGGKHGVIRTREDLGKFSPVKIIKNLHEANTTNMAATRGGGGCKKKNGRTTGLLVVRLGKEDENRAGGGGGDNERVLKNRVDRQSGREGRENDRVPTKRSGKGKRTHHVGQGKQGVSPPKKPCGAPELPTPVKQRIPGKTGTPKKKKKKNDRLTEKRRTLERRRGAPAQKPKGALGNKKGRPGEKGVAFGKSQESSWTKGRFKRGGGR